ncbi:MAG: hypothetical protein ACT4QB_19340 [Gammaproteobacteria bacterium]
MARFFFLERRGSASAAALRMGGEIRIATGARVRRLPAATHLKPDLVSCYLSGLLPEVVLVCANPDQLLGIIDSFVAVIERAHADGLLEIDTPPVPMLVLTANGIYFQRIRQLFIERIEEGTLYGRLPDLWPGRMPWIVGRLLRGVTLQSAIREGQGAETVYRPGPSGLTRLAGGEAQSRERCHAVLAQKGGWFEIAAHSSATRLEFDKAMFNLPANLLGQIYAIDDAGRFRPLTVAEVIVPAREPEIRALIRQVFRVGQAIKVYGDSDDLEALYAEVVSVWGRHADHVPSSLQWVDFKVREGTLEPVMTPTESWLLGPLVRYARSAGLDAAAGYFELLQERLVDKLTLAVHRRIEALHGVPP